MVLPPFHPHIRYDKRTRLFSPSAPHVVDSLHDVAGEFCDVFFTSLRAVPTRRTRFIKDNPWSDSGYPAFALVSGRREPG